MSAVRVAHAAANGLGPLSLRLGTSGSPDTEMLELARIGVRARRGSAGRDGRDTTFGYKARLGEIECRIELDGNQLRVYKSPARHVILGKTVVEHSDYLLMSNRLMSQRPYITIITSAGIFTTDFGVWIGERDGLGYGRLPDGTSVETHLEAEREKFARLTVSEHTKSPSLLMTFSMKWRAPKSVAVVQQEVGRSGDYSVVGETYRYRGTVSLTQLWQERRS
jgi:hypothetical protein